MKNTLIDNVKRITQPLFETFDFFSLNELQVKSMLQGLFNADKESD